MNDPSYPAREHSEHDTPGPGSRSDPDRPVRPVPDRDTGPGAPPAWAAPPADVPAADRPRHAALLYRDTEEYVEALLPHLVAGVRGGEPVVVVVPAARLGLLRERCAAEGVESGVRWLDAAEAAGNPGRLVPGVLHPLIGGPGTVVAELVWPGRPAPAYAACVRHEALANRLLAGRPLRLLCPYDAERLNPVSLADALTTHADVLDRGDWRPSPGYAPRTALEAYNRPFAEPAGASTLSVSPGGPGLAPARALAAGLAEDLGLDPERVGDVALVVTELLTNGVQHGGGVATLRVWSDAEGVTCEVSDTGVLSDPLAGLRPAPADQPNGRGLLLVHTLADLVSFHIGPAGTTIRVLFSTESGPAAAPDA
ncbi:sensor histidine kinase [Actinokineospora pegani]|uniref:sensor histidine kinase n=1 Tax=Actinokineospora pegani TaxID=2654637 RepID=UPI0012EA5DC4|nr:sensor histidine kinase [Actinokineospora pegani]